MRLVGDSTRSLWIVGDPNTGSGILSKQKDPQKSLANTSLAAKAGSPYKQGARARVTSGKANGRMLLAKDGRKPLVAGNERGTTVNRTTLVMSKRMMQTMMTTAMITMVTRRAKTRMRRMRKTW
jgi:pyruvate/2-oxoglutarate dehydrogenase complex dihydrolipoamide acyltransferase (E2) component